MYGKNSFKQPALPSCCGVMAKQEEVPLLQIQEIKDY